MSAPTTERAGEAAVASRRWLNYRDRLVFLDFTEPVTMYDGLTHALRPAVEPPERMFTLCGRRGCPLPGVRTVPGRVTVDCLDCLASREETR